MLKALGEELKRARESAGKSLERVASPANISTTYVQKLERGVVNSPSPRVLGRLAIVLELPYLRLMELAGYLDADQAVAARKRRPSPKAHPLDGAELTPEEWREVGDFIEALKGRRESAKA